jgi:hypothetical protein
LDHRISQHWNRKMRRRDGSRNERAAIIGDDEWDILPGILDLGMKYLYAIIPFDLDHGSKRARLLA